LPKAAENDRDEGDSVVPLCAQEKSAEGNLRIFLRYPSYSLDIVNEFAQLQTTEKMDLSPQLPDYVDEEVNPKVTRNGFLFVAVENDDEQFHGFKAVLPSSQEKQAERIHRINSDLVDSDNEVMQVSTADKTVVPLHSQGEDAEKTRRGDNFVSVENLDEEFHGFKPVLLISQEARAERIHKITSDAIDLFDSEDEIIEVPTTDKSFIPQGDCADIIREMFTDPIDWIKCIEVTQDPTDGKTFETVVPFQGSQGEHAEWIPEKHREILAGKC